jgi:hypothetical protein
MNLETLSEKLFTETDGIKVHRLVKRLIKESAQHREVVIEIFMNYARGGPLHHWRSFVISLGILPLIQSGENGYCDFFEQCLQDPATAYWSVDGLIKTSGRDSYVTLTRFALNPTNGTENRANAIKCLAVHSDQSFIKGLPSDPGHWLETDLPLQKLREWAESGYPQGLGFSPPERHPDLDCPISELDRLASALDIKLARLRAQDQDPTNPTNWLSPAAQDDMAAIRSRWQLPEIYSEFLRKFSPVKVTVRGRGFGMGLELYGSGELVRSQDGYSFNPIENKPIPDWPGGYLVIASIDGDPFVLDLSATKGNDAPVRSALHGQGTWEFKKVASSFLMFLKRLAT